MGATGAHTGEYKTILEWFQEHPELVMSIKDISEEFGITRVKASNILCHGVRKNELKRAEGVGVFQLRNPSEVREEFKVARVIPLQPKEPRMAYPVLKECTAEMASPELRQFLPPKTGDRIQFLNPSTAIIWNSATQLRNVRQMALGH